MGVSRREPKRGVVGRLGESSGGRFFSWTPDELRKVTDFLEDFSKWTLDEDEAKRARKLSKGLATMKFNPGSKTTISEFWGNDITLLEFAEDVLFRGKGEQITQ